MVKFILVITVIFLWKITVASASDAYVICNSEIYRSGSTLTSGWVLDNRGGSQNQSAQIVADTSRTLGCMLYRDFQAVDQGVLCCETSFRIVSGFDGLRLEFIDATGESVVGLTTVNGRFSIFQADGKAVPIYTPLVDERHFDVRLSVDMTGHTLRVVINETECAPQTFFGSEISRFAFTTSKADMLAFQPGHTKLYVDYVLNEAFDFYTSDSPSIPYGWVSSDKTKAYVRDGEAYVGDNGILRIDFSSEGDQIIECLAYFPDDTSGTLAIFSETGVSFAFKVSGGVFKIDDTYAYTYLPDQWYRLRFETNEKSQIVRFKLNGREIGVYPIKSYHELKRLSFVFSGIPMRLDDLCVYASTEKTDYVTAPQVPKGTENYLVGVNVCSLWNNDTHYGWNLITPFEEPYLGYYDEGNPEAADWEIKYMVEHGIDFQMVCWYAETHSAPLKKPYLSEYLHDGFQNAKYSEYMKYALLVECKNAEMPTSQEEWQQYYVPYFIENYFKDERYLVIDNKPVLAFFSIGSLMNSLTFGSKTSDTPGDWRELKTALDYLEGEVKKIGYDGVMLWSTDASNATLKIAGIDASFAYGFGVDGYSLSYNQQVNLERAKSEWVYTIPTISIGFNSIPWYGKRYPMMSVSDFALGQKWIKESYLPEYAKETWQKNLVMISNWNEYGEGTYIFPSKNNGGFGYLDALRNAYTAQAASSSTHVFPTLSQKQRITRKYPQNLRRIASLDLEDTSKGTGQLIVDEEATSLVFNGEMRGNEWCFPWDRSKLVSALHVHDTWDGKTLSVYGSKPGKYAVFTLDSEAYETDTGIHTLSEPIYTLDGYPMIPLARLCEALDISWEQADNGLRVQTDFYNSQPVHVKIAECKVKDSALYVKIHTNIPLGIGRCLTVCVYDDNRLREVRVVYPQQRTDVEVLFSKGLGANRVKVLAFSNLSRLIPLGASAEYHMQTECDIDVGKLIQSL